MKIKHVLQNVRQTVFQQKIDFKKLFLYYYRTMRVTYVLYNKKHKLKK